MISIGTTVICVRNDIKLTDIQLLSLRGITVPKVHKPYVVRGMRDFGNRTGLYLEEIINPVIKDIGIEPCFDILMFREVDTDISELTERLEAVCV